MTVGRCLLPVHGGWPGIYGLSLLLFPSWALRVPPRSWLACSPAPSTQMSEPEVLKERMSWNAPTLVGTPNTPEPPADSAVELTEGDFRGWLTVFGASLALFCSFGQLNAFGTFQTWYADHQLQHLPPSTIAWIGSLQLFVFFFSVSTHFKSACTCSFAPGRFCGKAV